MAVSGEVMFDFVSGFPSHFFCHIDKRSSRALMHIVQTLKDLYICVWEVDRMIELRDWEWRESDERIYNVEYGVINLQLHVQACSEENVSGVEVFFFVCWCVILDFSAQGRKVHSRKPAHICDSHTQCTVFFCSVCVAVSLMYIIMR